MGQRRVEQRVETAEFPLGQSLFSVFREDSKLPDGTHLQVRCVLDKKPYPIIDIPPPTILNELKDGICAWREARTLAEMSGCYQELFRQIRNEVPNEKAARVAYGRLSMLDYEFIFTGGAFSYSWGLVHALAQQEALTSLAAEASIGEEGIPAFCSDLIFKEQNLFCKTCVPSLLYHSEGVEEKRWWSLYFWHRSWLGSEYLGYPGDILIEGGVAVSKQAIERYYRNPFPGLLWIGFEGPDKSGKDTQADLLQHYLEDLTEDRVLSFSFPTEGLFGKLIKAALQGRLGIDNFTLQKLFVTDRASFKGEHLAGLQGIMVTRRHSASGIAYGPGGRVELLQRIVDNMGVGWADNTFLIDTSVEECLRRMRPGKKELFETVETLTRVRKNYLTLAELLPNVFVIEGMRRVESGEVLPRSPEEIFRDVVLALGGGVPLFKIPDALRDLILTKVDQWMSEHQDLFVLKNGR